MFLKKVGQKLKKGVWWFEKGGAGYQIKPEISLTAFLPLFVEMPTPVVILHKIVRLLRHRILKPMISTITTIRYSNPSRFTPIPLHIPFSSFIQTRDTRPRVSIYGRSMTSVWA